MIIIPLIIISKTFSFIWICHVLLEFILFWIGYIIGIIQEDFISSFVCIDSWNQNHLKINTICVLRIIWIVRRVLFFCNCFPSYRPELIDSTTAHGVFVKSLFIGRPSLDSTEWFRNTGANTIVISPCYK